VKRCVSVFLILVTLCVAYAASNSASGAGDSTQAKAGNSSCGTTVEDGLAFAQKALQSNNEDARAALGCLSAATNALNERVHSLEQSRPLFKTNTVPNVMLQPDK
jgi:predicted small secreted protein